ncbi:MAG: hypothetical protein Q8763_02905, partial [Candidatus Phytoplasma australasiaticum]|nr:hypothetical protein [Candidatus Phytoplasma australasiaticum]
FVSSAFGGARGFSLTSENVGVNPTASFTGYRFYTSDVDTPQMPMPLCVCKCNTCGTNSK